MLHTNIFERRYEDIISLIKRFKSSILIQHDKNTLKPLSFNLIKAFTIIKQTVNHLEILVLCWQCSNFLQFPIRMFCSTL